MHPRLRVSGFAVVLAATAIAPAVGLADPSAPAVEQRRQPSPSPDADNQYDRGMRARVAQDWTAAAEAFRRALALRPVFPEAWNELGFALRNQGRYAESLAAYDEALRQRPDFPEALEYLGEAYVKLGRLDDAQRVLERLYPLDPARAAELAAEIRTATR
jgi:tetratricopeptide (TPR) repeat protein